MEIKRESKYLTDKYQAEIPDLSKKSKEFKLFTHLIFLENHGNEGKCTVNQVIKD